MTDLVGEKVVVHKGRKYRVVTMREFLALHHDQPYLLHKVCGEWCVYVGEEAPKNVDVDACGGVPPA